MGDTKTVWKSIKDKWNILPLIGNIGYKIPSEVLDVLSQHEGCTGRPGHAPRPLAGQHVREEMGKGAKC